MLKIADSATIRHHMPTRPRNSCESGISGCGTAMVVAAKRESPFSSTQNRPPWRVASAVTRTSSQDLRDVSSPTTDDGFAHRNHGEVVIGRRGTGTPLQSPGIPGIVARQLAFEVRRD